MTFKEARKIEVGSKIKPTRPLLEDSIPCLDQNGNLTVESITYNRVCGAFIFKCNDGKLIHHADAEFVKPQKKTVLAAGTGNTFARLLEIFNKNTK